MFTITSAPDEHRESSSNQVVKAQQLHVDVLYILAAAASSATVQVFFFLALAERTPLALPSHALRLWPRARGYRQGLVLDATYNLPGLQPNMTAQDRVLPQRAPERWRLLQGVKLLPAASKGPPPWLETMQQSYQHC
eukprot:CAMPEP_0171678370 /NCGR_PEP_ID=MMETSP0990-20121206/55632_1 /TAXON_ID=483369 /ORGANISM="non described non described, Strain CCMP2098" /LENGTH=136 /DNA_ID=CAMNT_0012265013 /DNA_START=604 /DNA_END=1013 /DNA_ORIENTATION=-